MIFEKRGMFYGTAALFAFALLCGGLGPHAPLLGAAIEAVAFPVLVAAILFGRDPASFHSGAISGIVLVVLTLCLGAAQLVPLPAPIWQALPGRDIVTLVLGEVGRSSGPWPLSLAPDATRLFLQSLLPPTAIFIATLGASGQERFQLARLIVAGAVITSVLGLIQLSFGDGTLVPDAATPHGRYPGVFANYNHQAMFLAGAVALLPPLTARSSKVGGAFRLWPAAVWLLAFVAVLATTSRAGLLLFAGSTLVAAARVLHSHPSFARSRASLRGRMLPLVGVGLACVALTMILWFAGGYRVGLMVSRFGAIGNDARYEFWVTTLAAITAYFPVGSGFGTFEPVYQLAEPLAAVGNAVVNHAHNDYLEWILEAGLPGLFVLFLFFAWFVARIVHIRRRDGGERGDLAWSGAVIVVLVMIHSLGDYPLRTEAIGCMFAFACGLLVRAPHSRQVRVHAGAASSREIAA